MHAAEERVIDPQHNLLFVEHVLDAVLLVEDVLLQNLDRVLLFIAGQFGFDDLAEGASTQNLRHDEVRQHLIRFVLLGALRLFHFFNVILLDLSAVHHTLCLVVVASCRVQTQRLEVLGLGRHLQL